MGEQTTTISVEPETLQRFKEAKAQLDGFQSGVPDHSADSFLNALLDTWDAVDEGYYETIPDEPAETISGALADDEVAIVGAQGTLVDELVDRLEAATDPQDTAAIVDDLVTQLPPKIADELEGRR